MFLKGDEQSSSLLQGSKIPYSIAISQGQNVFPQKKYKCFSIYIFFIKTFNRIYFLTILYNLILYREICQNSKTSSLYR